MPTFTYAPPTPSPGETGGSPSPTNVQTVSPTMTQMPTTGPSDAVYASAGLGIGLALLGGILLLAMAMRKRRLRTG